MSAVRKKVAECNRFKGTPWLSIKPSVANSYTMRILVEILHVRLYPYTEPHFIRVARIGEAMLDAHWNGCAFARAEDDLSLSQGHSKPTLG